MYVYLTVSFPQKNNNKVVIVCLINFSSVKISIAVRTILLFLFHREVEVPLTDAGVWEMTP